jgi:hypothetical protein
MLARLVADVAAEHFPRCSVLFLPFLNTGGHGSEPDSTTATKMRRADVLLGLTTYSLSHNNAREAVTRAGGRVSLASTIWQRRTLKASDEHKPSSSCLRSSSVRLRTYTGFLMPSIISLSRISCLNLHQGKTLLSWPHGSGISLTTSPCLAPFTPAFSLSSSHTYCTPYLMRTSCIPEGVPL